MFPKMTDDKGNILQTAVQMVLLEEILLLVYLLEVALLIFELWSGLQLLPPIASHTISVQRQQLTHGQQ